MEISGSKSPRGLIESPIGWKKRIFKPKTVFCQVRPVRFFPNLSMVFPGIRSQDPFHGNQPVEISPGSYRAPDWFAKTYFQAKKQFSFPFPGRPVPTPPVGLGGESPQGIPHHCLSKFMVHTCQKKVKNFYPRVPPSGQIHLKS